MSSASVDEGVKVRCARCDKGHVVRTGSVTATRHAAGTPVFCNRGCRLAWAAAQQELGYLEAAGFKPSGPLTAWEDER